MPELPEVETIARALRQGGRGGQPLPGRVIQAAHLLWPRTLDRPTEVEMLAWLPGQPVQAVSRRGKFLRLQLECGTLLIHLRMSGDLRVEPVSAPTQPHDRLLIDFADGMRLAFNDTRKFGRVWLVEDEGSVLGRLGPEPLEDGFTPELLYNMLQSTRRQLKPLLLDQKFVAGLGNIYTDEALHLARLHPHTPADTLSAAQAGELWTAIRQVLNHGIDRQGASFDWVYRGGDFQNYFSVYQRTGQPCPVCGTPIQRLVVGQRGTHVCPVCQPEPVLRD